MNKFYKSCFVPDCKNTTIRTPEKLFFSVPVNEDVRKKWFASARRLDQPGKSNFYCCQDHFNIKDDMESYVRYMMMGAPTKLKKDVVPHIFECQNRKSCTTPLSREAYQKLNRKRAIEEILRNNEQENMRCCPGVAEPLSKKMQRNVEAPAKHTSTEDTDVVNLTSSNSELLVERTSEENAATSADDSMSSTKKTLRTSSSAQTLEKIPQITMHSVGVQVKEKRHFRSKGILIKPEVRNKGCQTEIFEKEKTPQNSPTKSLVSTISLSTNSSNISTFAASENTSSFLSNGSDQKKEEANEMKNKALQMTTYFISVHPRFYIGIDSSWLGIIDLLQKHTKCSMNDIKMTLMKIRRNDSFSRLGNQFGLSASQASRSFKKTVIPLAHFLKTLVYCPDRKIIKKNLPIPFRASYSHVCSIVDAFEIHIEKPSDSLMQALTWSDYKKGNTFKYLISCTPDGFINFLSEGYGGRISDTLLFEESKIIDILPEKCGVMCDRGFKLVQTVLNKKKCELIRPPSVSASEKPTKKEVLETKTVASLRIHVERVIRRVREFEILQPFSCIDCHLSPVIDECTIIAAGLINLQNPIIRQ